MVIEKILKQLTPARIKKEVEAIQKIELPPELQKWVKEYEKVGGGRNEFFWKSIYKLHKTINPFSIPSRYKNSLCETKFLITMFIVLIDDMVDMGQKNQNLLNNLLPFQAKQKNNRLNKITSSEKQYIKFVETVLKNINKKIEKYPYSKNFHNIFNYDIAQTVNAMRYSRLVNQNPYLINTIEHWLYSPHTLQGMINCTLDLMCAGNFDSVKTGKARESFWLAHGLAKEKGYEVRKSYKDYLPN